MEKYYDPTIDKFASGSSMKWESRGLIIGMHKALDSRLPPINIDVASTLGSSNNLPLAVKKAVRYWFHPGIKTKNDVVRYVNEACRHNGFKISTLSNSKQGLDRRAQLVCSRGIIARKPRGKSQGIQTTTSRPISQEEKCPFSLTVYECRQSARWYIRKYGNGSRMHCGHCQLLPEQVGIRRFQNLTEKNGEDWCEGDLIINSSIHERHRDEKVGERSHITGDESSAKKISNEILDANAGENMPLMRIRPDLCADNNVAQNQKQIFEYIEGLRHRIACRNYNDQILLNRALYSEQVESGIKNLIHRQLLDRIGKSSESVPWESNSMNLDSLLQYTGGIKHLNNDQISKYVDQSMVLNHLGRRETLNFTERNELTRRCEDGLRDQSSAIDERNMSLLLNLKLERAKADFLNIRKKSCTSSISPSQNQHRSTHSSGTEDKCLGSVYNNDTKRSPNDDDFYISSQLMTKYSKTVSNDTKNCVDNTIPNHRSSEILSESGNTASFGKTRDKLVGNQISNGENIVCYPAVKEIIGSNTNVDNSSTKERGNHLEGRIEMRKQIPSKSDDPQRSTATADWIGSYSCAKSITNSEVERFDKDLVHSHVANGIDESANESTTTDFNFVNDYSMLQPMVMCEYSSALAPNSELAFGASRGQQVPNSQIKKG